ncbi:MAG: PIN domain-containing protein [Deltaproteobacteria bacterium]|nr:PIN domain-containing protein [Deltaproteobacteria bacterium]
MILVDSSVWIAAWRGHHPDLMNKLSVIVEAGEAVINPLIRTELLQGAKDKAHQKKLTGLLDPIPVDLITSEIWDAAPVYYLECREKGITLTTVDCLIATHSFAKKISLWSLDKVFNQLPKIRLFSA